VFQKTKTKVKLLHLYPAMKYIDFLWALDVLAKYYPRYQTSDLLMLADDVWKWLNNELPEDSSALVYLKNCFDSPADAFKAVWKEIQLISDPLLHQN
jgi:hypothetical protein